MNHCVGVEEEEQIAVMEVNRHQFKTIVRNTFLFVLTDIVFEMDKKIGLRFMSAEGFTASQDMSVLHLSCRCY